MKFDFVYTLVALATAALLAWGIYAMTSVDELKWMTTIVSFISLGVSGVCSIGVKIGEHRSSVVLQVTSIAFFLFLLFVNGIFSFFDFSKPLYIIINALTLLILIIVCRAVAKSGM